MRRPDIQAVGHGIDHRGGGQALDPLDRVDALDVAGDALDVGERRLGEERLGEGASSATIRLRVPPNSARKRS